MYNMPPAWGFWQNTIKNELVESVIWSLLFTANRSQISIKNIFPLYVFYHVRHEKLTVLHIFCRKRKFCPTYILTKIIEDIPPWAILRP